MVNLKLNMVVQLICVIEERRIAENISPSDTYVAPEG